MKSIDKVLINVLINITKRYKNTGDVNLLSHRIDISRQLSEQAFGTDSHWLSFSNMISGGVGLNPEATNEEVYKIFEDLGFQIK